MEEESFGQLVRTLHRVESFDPINFQTKKYIDLLELTEEQKLRPKEEFKKKIEMEYSLFYGYFENDYSGF